MKRLLKGLLQPGKILTVFIIFLNLHWLNASPISITNDPFTYDAQYTDSESSNVYLINRFYNPQNMRFLQRDTYQFINRYSYTAGNPIMRDDPSGHQFMFDDNQWGGIAQGIGGVAAFMGRGKAPWASIAFIAFVVALNITNQMMQSAYAGQSNAGGRAANVLDPLTNIIDAVGMFVAVGGYASKIGAATTGWAKAGAITGAVSSGLIGIGNSAAAGMSFCLQTNGCDTQIRVYHEGRHTHIDSAFRAHYETIQHDLSITMTVLSVVNVAAGFVSYVGYGETGAAEEAGGQNQGGKADDLTAIRKDVSAIRTHLVGPEVRPEPVIQNLSRPAASQPMSQSWDSGVGIGPGPTEVNSALVNERTPLLKSVDSDDNKQQ